MPRETRCCTATQRREALDTADSVLSIHSTVHAIVMASDCEGLEKSPGNWAGIFRSESQIEYVSTCSSNNNLLPHPRTLNRQFAGTRNLLESSLMEVLILIRAEANETEH